VISFHSYWGLGSRYVFLFFHYDATAHHVLQFGTFGVLLVVLLMFSHGRWNSIPITVTRPITLFGWLFPPSRLICVHLLIPPNQSDSFLEREGVKAYRSASRFHS